MKKLLCVLLCLALIVCCFSGCEKKEVEDFPNGKINLHVPFGVGGNLDLKARLVAKYLEKELNQQVVVINKVGAAGLVGTTEFLLNDASGYDLIFLPDNSYCLAPLVSKVNYKVEDITPITGFDIEEFGLFANPKKSSLSNFEELKASNAKIIFGSGGPSTVQYYVTKAILKASGNKNESLQHGSQPEGFTNILGGHSSLMLGGKAAAKQYVESGEMVAILTTSEKGWKDYVGSDVPSAKELGVDVMFESFTFFGVKTGTPKEQMEKLNDAFGKVFKNAEFLKEMEKFDPVYATISSAEATKKMLDSYNNYQTYIDAAK